MANCCSFPTPYATVVFLDDVIFRVAAVALLFNTKKVCVCYMMLFCPCKISSCACSCCRFVPLYKILPPITGRLLFTAVYYSPPFSVRRHLLYLPPFTIRRHFLSSSIILKPNPRKPHAPRGAPFPFSSLYLNIT